MATTAGIHPSIGYTVAAGKREHGRYVSHAGSNVVLAFVPRPTTHDFGPSKISWIPSDFMDLRDKFAVHIAAALAGAFSDPAQIARRSYDFAEALVAERTRRIDADELRAIAEALPFGAIDSEFNPDELDPEWLEQRHDPTWDIEPRWTAEPAPVEAAPDTTRAQGPATEVVRPGLARTQPADVEPHRAAGHGA
jgi:hypothetical protein